jgi:hypothetical protein
MMESEPHRPGPTIDQVENAWVKPPAWKRTRLESQSVKLNDQGREIWFERWGLGPGSYMPSTAMGMYLYLGFIFVLSLWFGLIALLMQFGVLSDGWAIGVGAPPVAVGVALWWRTAHRHSESEGRPPTADPG